jgi:hypothetical protein
MTLVGDFLNLGCEQNRYMKLSRTTGVHTVGLVVNPQPHGLCGRAGEWRCSCHCTLEAYETKMGWCVAVLSITHTGGAQAVQQDSDVPRGPCASWLSECSHPENRSRAVLHGHRGSTGVF